MFIVASIPFNAILFLMLLFLGSKSFSYPFNLVPKVGALKTIKKYDFSLQMSIVTNSKITDTTIDGKIYSGKVIERLNDKLLVEYVSSELDIEQKAVLCKQKMKNSSITVVVGDEVDFIIDENDVKELGTAIRAKARKNVLERPSPGSLKRNKISMKTIASNIDQIIIVTSAKPAVPLLTIDQFIVGAICANIPNILLVVNKFDQPEALLLLEDYKAYLNIGYNILSTSTKSNHGIEELEEYLRNKTSIFVGQSGTGKSSLINRIIPSALAKVGDLVEKVDLGAHTTSNARLYRLPKGGNIIDSPGIREFGLWHYDGDTIRRGFREIHEESFRCKFNDCKHDTRSPGCAVREAISLGKISRHRWVNYNKVLGSINV